MRWRPGGDKERLNQRGYRNQFEAELLADLAVHYACAHREWGVIVPYLAQAELIRKMLAGRAGSAAVIRLNVGTVDSFQGGERDVILYGLTRSNPERRVGFLSELRRVNVAISRAKMQLVMVGDSEPFDLIDRFLEAAIVKGRLQTEAGVVGYLAYTQASQEADPEWSQVCSVAEEVAALVENEYQSGRDEGEEKAARRWAEKRSLGGQYDIGWRSGLLVATFPASAVTCGGRDALPPQRIGSFVKMDGWYFRVWCEAGGYFRPSLARAAGQSSPYGGDCLTMSSA